MTPTELNKRIRAGEFFWVETNIPFHGAPHICQQAQVREARTVTKVITEEALISDNREGSLPGDKIKVQVKRQGERLVKVRTDFGWQSATRVRPSGGDWIALFGEGRIDHAIN